MDHHQDEDESFVANDIDLEGVDWDQVVALQERYDEVDSIVDDKTRLEVARKLVSEMNHG